MPKRHSQSLSLIFTLSIWLLLLCSTPAFCDEYEYAVDAEGGTAHLSNADNNNDAISPPVSPPDILDDDDEDEDEDENYYENRDEDDEEIRDYYGDEEEGYEYDEEYASEEDYYGEEGYDEEQDQDQEHEEWEDEGDYYYDENENENENDGEEYKSQNDLYMTSEEYADLLKTKHKDFDWKIHGSTSDLWFNLGCEELFQSPRPLHSQSDWVNARNIYKSIVKDESTLPNDNDGDDNDNDSDGGNSHSGFEVKVVAKQSPGKGRGIYAVEDIKEGDLIYSSKQTARFSSGAHYREFLLALQPHFACDVLQWAFVTELDDKVNGKEELQLKISVDLDEGCFCNNGWGPVGEEEGPNLGCNQDQKEGEEFPPSCKTNFYALRDIKAGEEFLCSYGDFVIGDGWHEFGLGATW